MSQANIVVRSSSQRWRVLLAAIFVAATSGCVKKEVQGDALHFSMEWWTFALVIAAGAALMFFCFTSISGGEWRGILGFIAGAFLFIGVAPGMLMDYALLDDKHLEGRYGLWFSPTKYDIVFADVRDMRVVETKSYSRRGSKYNYRLDLHYKNGQSSTISLGDLLKEAIDDVSERAGAAGVQILPMQTAE